MRCSPLSRLRRSDVIPAYERMSHYLRSEARLRPQRLGPAGAEALQARPGFSQRIESPIVDTVTGRASAATLIGDVTYTLTTLDGSKVLSSGKATASASYDRAAQRFATVRAARDADIRLAKVLSEQIRTRARPRRWRAAPSDAGWSPSKAGDVAGILRRRPIRAFAMFLVYGPDAGLVAERARPLAEARVDDPADPFQLIRLDGDAVAGDPARLMDEAATIGLFGSRRAIWVKATSRNLAGAVEPLLRAPLEDTTVVIEGGDLAEERAAAGPLRTGAGRARPALLQRFGQGTRRNRGHDAEGSRLTIGREAKAALLGSLGGDRLATRGELMKLDPLCARRGARSPSTTSMRSSATCRASPSTPSWTRPSRGIWQASRRAQAIASGGRRGFDDPRLGPPARFDAAPGPARRRGRPVPGRARESWRGLHFRRKPLMKSIFSAGAPTL